MDWAKALSIVFSSALKFFLGPIVGRSVNMEWYYTALFTAIGMMLSVVIVSYLGTYLRDWIASKRDKNKKIFTPSRRKIISIWKKFGIAGVAAITPLLLTPIGGSVVAVGFGVPPKTIIVYMSLAAIFWGIVLTLLVYSGVEGVGMLIKTLVD